MSDGRARNRMKLPSFRHLGVFEAVAQFNNLSRAAAVVNMSQPAVTQAIMNVEAWAGAALFQRSSTGAFLTNEGRIFLDCVRLLFDRVIGSFERDLMRGQSQKTIRLVLFRLKAAHINVLSAVARTQSFEDAALISGLSHATVQRTAREFETIVGRPLYVRGAKGFMTTPVAGEFARDLQLACQELLEGMHEIALIGDESATRIFIGAQPLASRTLLAAAIERTLEKFPQARIRIIEGTYPYLLQELRSGRIDLMFGGLQRPRTIDDVAEEPLFEEPYCVVARAGHPLCDRKGLTLDHLGRFDWVLPGPGTQRRAAFDQLFRQHKQKPTSSITTTSATAQVAILKRSDRITLLTRTELALDEWTRGVKALPIRTVVPRSADGLTMRLNWRPTAAQQGFIDHLRETVRDCGLSMASAGRESIVFLHDLAQGD